MDQMDSVSNSVPQPLSEQERNGYTGLDAVYAWLCLVLGYLFCRSFPMIVKTLGGFVFLVVLFAVSTAVLLLKKVRIPWKAILSAVSALVIGSALLISENAFLGFCASAYALVSYCYFICAAFSATLETGFSDFTPLDYLRAVFVLPFSAFGSLFFALRNGGGKKSSLAVGKVLLGIALAAIPTAIIVSNLSYDAGFVKIMKDIFRFEAEDLVSQFVSILFALPLGMYLFGLMRASQLRGQLEKKEPEVYHRAVEKLRLLPPITVITAVIPIVFVYVIFFISQWQYYLSAFTGILPEGFSHAEYAREGFFQLCGVSALNLIVMVLTMFFVKGTGKKRRTLLGILCWVFCLMTLVLIATAVSKLVLYIQAYGLTPKRIYAMWFMALIGIVFTLLAIGQLLRRCRLTVGSMAVCIVLFAGLCLCNVDALCANYNVEQFLSGKLPTVDILTMDAYGDSAVPAMLRLKEAYQAQPEPADEKWTELNRRACAYLEDRAMIHRDTADRLFEQGIPYWTAHRALEAAGYDLTPEEKTENMPEDTP